MPIISIWEMAALVGTYKDGTNGNDRVALAF